MDSFMIAIAIVSKPLLNTKGQQIGMEYYRAASRLEDIDVLQFYRDLLPNIPILEHAVRSILGDQSASTSGKRAFSYCNMVLSARRIGLTSERASQRWVSAMRAKNEKKKRHHNLTLPELGGERGGNEVFNDDNDDEVTEEAPVAEFGNHDNFVDHGAWGLLMGTF